ncbi:MAG: AN1-type zinc finger protein [Candidatus Hodarchaeales archaeon]
MNLNEKYLAGLIIIALVSFTLFTSIGVIVGLKFLDDFPIKFKYLVYGVITLFVSIIFYILLFAPDRIKGFKGVYEVSPDLKQFKVVSIKKEKIEVNETIPDEAFCAVCGKKIYRPFRCNVCGQLLCGKHYLPGDHTCRGDLDD